MKRLLIAVTLAASVAFSVGAQVATATPAQARTIVKQAKVIKKQKADLAKLRRQVASLRTSLTADTTARVQAMAPDEVWALVAVIATKLTTEPYSATFYENRGDLSDYTNWSFTKYVFHG